MKNWLTANLGLKILSIFFAVGLWVIVVNVDDPVTTKTFKNVPVIFKNENVLADAGLVYQVLDGSDTVSFTVRAKRSVIESLSKEDFRAEADFSERIAENSVPIKVSALKHEEQIVDIDLQKNTVKIAVEDEVEKTVSVNLQVVGNAAEGFTVGKTDISPSEISVSGPRSLIDNVDNMVVVLDASNANEDISRTIEGQLFDKNGNVISDGRIVNSTKEFHVSAKLLHTKSVDLDFSVQGTVRDGYRYTQMNYEPTTVLIAGEVSDLDKISTIVFPPSELNIDNADKDVVKTVEVSKYLPDNIIVVNDNEKKVTVTLNVVPLNTRRITFPVTKIDVLNTPLGLNVNFEGKLYVDIDLRGLNEDLNNLTEENISVSVDVKGLTEGIHTVQAKINTNNENIQVVSIPQIEVALTSFTGNEAPPASEAPVTPQDNPNSDTTGTEGN